MEINTKYSKTFLLVLAFEFTLFLGVVRYLVGPEWSFEVFYLLPICVATWYVSKRSGIIISICSIIVWFIADLSMKNGFSHPLIPYFNQVFRLVVFIFVVFTLSRMKEGIDKERELSLTDLLTGIANRRSFFKSANIEINRASRFNRPFSVVYIDLDNFKTINDRFGHETGDRLLILLTTTVKSNIRAYDVLARVGGDEFIIILPETGDEIAGLVVRRIHEKILNLLQENKWPVTCSIGVLTFKDAPHNADDIIRNADLLMYSVKQDGKNMIKHKVMDKDSMLSIEGT